MSDYQPISGIPQTYWNAYAAKTQDESGLILVSSTELIGWAVMIDFMSVTAFLGLGDNWSEATLWLGDLDGDVAAPLITTSVNSVGLALTSGAETSTYTNETAFPFPATGGDGTTLVLKGSCSTINSYTGFAAFASGRLYTAWP